MSRLFYLRRGRAPASTLTGSALILALAVFGTGASASVTLDFASLPSAQGWTYWVRGNTAPETSVFQVDGSTLYQNTMGLPLGGGGSNRYNLYGAVDGSVPFTLKVRARVLEEESRSGYHFGFCFAVFTGTEEIGIGLGTQHIQDVLLRTLSTSIDNTQWHNYRLEGSFGTGGGYSLYVDDMLVGTGPPRSIVFPNQLCVGDGTGNANARAEVTEFRFIQALTVDIDIKPGSDPNSINLDAQGFLPVAILGSGRVDLTEVNVATIALGGTDLATRGKAKKWAYSMDDVNNDGEMDLVAFFSMPELVAEGALTETTTSLALTAQLFDETPIDGTDSVRIVPPE